MPASVEPGDRPGTWVVRKDGMDQSAVDLADPRRLDFDYVRRIADVLDALPPGPLRVLHLGGAGLTLPRYVLATRPGSRQVVLEPDVDLMTLVRERIPLPRRSGVSVREVDGRTGLADVRDGWAQAVVVDAFERAELPADLVSVEAWADLVRVADPAAPVVVNHPDRAPFAATRAALAGLRLACDDDVAVGAETAVLRGKRHGNLVLVARAPSAALPSRGRDHTWLRGSEVGSRFGGGRPSRDGDGPPVSGR